MSQFVPHIRFVLGACVAVALIPRLPIVAESPRGDIKSVSVTAATRLDFVFPLANQSPKSPPEGWIKDYDSAKQTYELFVPANYTKKKSWPVILFISPSDSPMGRFLSEACAKSGFILAGPRGAGNRCPIRKRVRIVLDVLDDVRRKYRIDPDRTYIGGFSGGGRVACMLGFALPELFGGVIPVCAAGDLREESWLRHRVIDRVSVAHITGTGDFNRGEVERFRGPMLKEVGVRSRVWTIPRMGHSVPSGKAWLPVLKWLEADLPRRRMLASKYPASRIAGKAAPTRDDWANSLLAEAKIRLKTSKTRYSGLRQLVGIRTRWAGSKAATEATKTLRQYEGMAKRPWEKDDIAEQRRFLIARARALDSYGTGPLHRRYVAIRPRILKAALQLWKVIEKDGQNAAAVKQAKKRIPALQERLKKDDP